RRRPRLDWSKRPAQRRRRDSRRCPRGKRRSREPRKTGTEWRRVRSWQDSQDAGELPVRSPAVFDEIEPPCAGNRKLSAGNENPYELGLACAERGIGVID